MSNDIFDLETERIFARNWICVGRAEEFGVGEEDSFRTLSVGRYGILVIRKSDGSFIAFQNTCRHRGTRLIDQPHGTIADSCVACPYHAWTYDLDGCLTDAPNMVDMPEFRREDYGLQQIGCVNWAGFIMLNLEKPREEFECDLDPIIQRVADWEFEKLKLAGTVRYDVKANWKLLFQNYNECSHLPTADVPDVAKAVGISKRSLEIKFKQALGRSPFADLELVRMANAKRLLANSDLPVSEVADQCGYRSLQTFSTSFHRQVEMTPTQYRNQFLGEAVGLDADLPLSLGFS